MGLPRWSCGRKILKTLAWSSQGHWISFWRKLQGSAPKPYFPTTVHTTLGWSLTKFGYDQCVRVKMPCLLYTSRVHIGVTSRKLRISYLPETLYILSFWEVRLIQFLAKYHIFRLRISCWRMGYLSFHAKCDNMSATITVIQRTDGFISGGFSGWLQKLQSFRDLGVPDNLTTRVLMR